MKFSLSKVGFEDSQRVDANVNNVHTQNGRPQTQESMTTDAKSPTETGWLLNPIWMIGRQGREC